jgi:hypothetical protein
MYTHEYAKLVYLLAFEKYDPFAKNGMKNGPVDHDSGRVCHWQEL